MRRDEVIFFPSLAASGSEVVFRRIEYYDAEQQRTLVFLTNHLELAAATIAAFIKTAGRSSCRSPSSRTCE